MICVDRSDAGSVAWIHRTHDGSRTYTAYSYHTGVIGTQGAVGSGDPRFSWYMQRPLALGNEQPVWPQQVTGRGRTIWFPLTTQDGFLTAVTVGGHKGGVTCSHRTLHTCSLAQITVSEGSWGYKSHNYSQSVPSSNM